jgi:hypothetical protein
MLAVFGVWGWDTEGDAENPAAIWSDEKRVGISFEI